MKKILLSVLVFVAAFALAAVFMSNVQAQTYNYGATNSTTASGTTGTTGTMSSGTTSGASGTTTSTSSTSPGLPNTGGGGARFFE